MKKLLIVLLVCLALVGCTSKPKETEHLTVLSPKGAPSLSLINYFKEVGDEKVITTVDGTDALTAAFTNPNSEYDMIIAPINLGSALIKKGVTDYRLAGVVTWGNLYIVSGNIDLTLPTLKYLAAFGQNAVPNKVLDTVLQGQEVEVTYFNAVSDVAAQLLSLKHTAGLVAEPVASTVMNKMSDMEIMIDMQEEWKRVTGYDNYPQAAIFVHKDVYAEKKDSYEAIFDLLTEEVDMTTLKADMDSISQEVLGVASGVMSNETYDRMNIEFKYANDVKDEILAFLKLFGIEDISEIVVK